MGLFGFGGKSKADLLREVASLESQLQEGDAIIASLTSLCDAKDKAVIPMISDGLRHGSSEAAKFMADRKKFLHGK